METTPVRTRQTRQHRVLPGLILALALLAAAPPARADLYDAPVAQTPAQAEHTAERRHWLLLFPAGVAALTLALIVYTRRK